MQSGVAANSVEAIESTQANLRTTNPNFVPWIFAVADPAYDPANWWKRYRRDPKRSGEISQAAFLLKARMLGFKVALPWGDSERYDFVVWAHEGSAMLRVQVKSTGRLYRRGYEIQPVHSTRASSKTSDGRRRSNKLRYTKKDIDILVAHVQPADAWYILPIEAIGRARSLRLYPDINSQNPRWETYRDNWKALEP